MHDTGLETKRENIKKFFDLISNQFNYGGIKYQLGDVKDRELTDVICDFSPGKTGCDWIMQTMVKYIGRFLNQRREKDLLKIATFAYLAWLKSGFHLSDKHDEDVGLDPNECCEVDVMPGAGKWTELENEKETEEWEKEKKEDEDEDEKKDAYQTWQEKRNQTLTEVREEIKQGLLDKCVVAD